MKNNYEPLYFDVTSKKEMPTVPALFSDIDRVDGSFGHLSDVGKSSGEKGEKSLKN